VGTALRRTVFFLLGYFGTIRIKAAPVEPSSVPALKDAGVKSAFPDHPGIA
jgi:hypothetical protein